MKTDFLTPVGRLVQGDPFEAQTKNMQGQPLMTQAGQPTQRYFIAVAFAKTDAAFGLLYAKLKEVARADFPQLFDAAGNCTHPRFSWKLIDGDGVDDNGKPNKNKEGFAGHWVLKFSSSFAPRCFHAGHYQPHEQIQDAKAIQRGYFVRVAGTIEGNGNIQKPGLYVNLNMVELAGVGPIISSGPDAGAVFGAAGGAAPLPVGAQPLPMHAGSAPPVAVSMPMPTPAALPAMLVNVPAVGIPQLPTPVAVAPNPAFLAGPGAPQAPLAPMAPPMPVAPPVARQMTAAAGAYTYEQYVAAGWDDAKLRAHGMML